MKTKSHFRLRAFWEMMKSIKDLPGTIEDKINTAIEAKLNERFPEEEEIEEWFFGKGGPVGRPVPD